MPNSAPGFASRPDYRVDLVPESRRIKVVFGGATIADTSSALLVEETGHGPVYYIPERNMRMDLLQPTDHQTHCPFKGDASYWTIETAGGARSENAVWGYQTPFDEVAGLAGHYAFYGSRVDAVEVT